MQTQCIYTVTVVLAFTINLNHEKQKHVRTKSGFNFYFFTKLSKIVFCLSIEYHLITFYEAWIFKFSTLMEKKSLIFLFQKHSQLCLKKIILYANYTFRDIKIITLNQSILKINLLTLYFLRINFNYARKN